MKTARFISVLCFLYVLSFSVQHSDAGATPKILPVHSKPYGLSYAEWSARWWQWAFSLPADQNPFFDETGCLNGANGQSGHVWFLTGVINVSGVATRECYVPVGKALFFPVINVECSTVEPPPFFGANEGELRECAESWTFGSVAAEIDGVPVANIESYRVVSPIFDIILPDNNVLGVDPGLAQSVSNGIFLMVAPLSKGTHVVHFTGTFVDFDFTLDITYILHVE